MNPDSVVLLRMAQRLDAEMTAMYLRSGGWIRPTVYLVTVRSGGRP